MRHALFSICLIVLTAFGCVARSPVSRVPDDRRFGSAVYYGSAVQLGGDIGGTGTAPVVNSISGPSPMLISAPILEWTSSAGASTLTQQSSTSGAGVSLSIYPQKPQPGSAAVGGTLFVTGTNKDGAGNYSDSYFGDWNLNNYFHVIPRTVGNGNVAILAETNGIQLTTTGQINLSAATGIGGPSGTPLAFLPVTITTPTTGTLTLSAAQIAASRLRLSMTLTGALTVVFPNQLGSWRVSLSGVTFGGFTIAFKSGSTTSATVASITTTTQLVDVETYGSNTIDVGTL